MSRQTPCRPCVQCHKSTFPYDICDECDMALASKWPIALGHAIRRCARRVEVDDLYRDVRAAWRVGMDICKPPTPEEKRRAVDALVRLRALAMEGTDR